MIPKEIKDKYTIPEMLDMLPAEVIKGRKNFFYLHEVFDLAIRKSKLFNTWTVEYFNDRTVKTLFQHQSTDLSVCLATMVQELIENKYITL
jgi:hypothetical protein